jgi:hypothetical protein
LIGFLLKIPFRIQSRDRSPVQHLKLAVLDAGAPRHLDELP